MVIIWFSFQVGLSRLSLQRDLHDQKSQQKYFVERHHSVFAGQQKFQRTYKMTVLIIFSAAYKISFTRTVASGPIDVRRSSARVADQHVATFAETALFWTFREIVGRLECDLQEVTARSHEPGEVQKEFYQGLRTIVRVRRRRRRRRGDSAQGQEEGPADIEQWTDRRRGMQVEPHFDRFFLWIHGLFGTDGGMSAVDAHQIR